TPEARTCCVPCTGRSSPTTTAIRSRSLSSVSCPRRAHECLHGGPQPYPLPRGGSAVSPPAWRRHTVLVPPRRCLLAGQQEGKRLPEPPAGRRRADALGRKPQEHRGALPRHPRRFPQRPLGRVTSRSPTTDTNRCPVSRLTRCRF